MEYRLSIEQANRLTIRYIILPVFLLAGAAFVLCLSHWDFSFWTKASAGFWMWMLSYLGWMLLFIGSVLGGVFVHEGIHGALIAVFAKGGVRSVCFGFDKKTKSPYAHSKVPLRAWQMSAVCLGPLLLQGLLPFAVALWTGSVFLFVLSVIFIVAAGGDMLYVKLLAKTPAKTLVEDLPDAVGYRTIP